MKQNVLIFMIAVVTFYSMGCGNKITVNSYVSIHRNVVFSTNEAVVSLPDIIERETAIVDGSLTLQPGVDNKYIKIQFKDTPDTAESVFYVSQDELGRQYEFSVFEGSPLTAIDLTKYTGEIKSIDVSMTTQQAEDHIISGDHIVNIIAFHYSIKWESNELQADVDIIQSAHSESDPLLN